MNEKNDHITVDQFEAALDRALYVAMTNGVPLMIKGSVVLDDDGCPMMVSADANILAVAERRAKAKRSVAGPGQGAFNEVASMIASARESGLKINDE